MKPIPFRKMIKGKVIVTFLIACTALFLAWSVSNFAFQEMLQTVRSASEPNERLVAVNNLYRKITILEQFQRSTVKETPEQTYARFRTESRLLSGSLDSLKALYKGENPQIRRISSMKALLRQREKLFADYLQVRAAVVDNQALEGEVNSLNELLSDSTRLPDSSTILKSENRYTTTLIPMQRQETPAGFLRRLFGRRKTSPDSVPQKIVNEELSITIDTIASTQRDTLFRTVDSVLVNLQRKQREQTGRFISRERQLSQAGHVLVNQMLRILDQVEDEVVKQTKANQAKTASLVAGSSREIKMIIFAFFLAAAFLLYFILRDITRNNRYRQRLEFANQEAIYHGQAKQRFLSNMSHEIRTPLQAIMGYAELAQKTSGRTRKNMDAIYKSSTHLLQIVNEVLDYSALISGKFTLDKGIFSLKAVADEVLTVMHVQAEQRGIPLVLDYECANNLYLVGDSFRLKQVIYNLLGNALKFTEIGEVRLGFSGKERDGDFYLEIKVSDTGVGIGEDAINRIFAEFERGDSNNGEYTAGSGLGLSIVKALVESQNGRIYVKSNQGEGTCFTVFLPFMIADADEITPTTTLAVRDRFPDTVWMVDDDRFILELCSTIFEKNGIRYECFDDPAKILEKEPDDQLGCVLLDMRMPGMDGAELCKRLRKKLPAGMYIFALTAQALPWEQENIMRQGFDGLLMKPFREDQLLELIYSTREDLTVTVAPDLRFVNEMVNGDIERSMLILKQFVSDTMADITALELAAANLVRDEMSLLVHRIAGRTAQIGSSDLAADFRMMELKLNQNGKIGPDDINELNELILRLRNLAEFVSRQADEFADDLQEG